jgi:type II secretory pathway predicted ATPase ExeA
MLSDVLDHYGLSRELRHAGYFETEHHQEIFKELKAAIKLGKLIALTGLVGCGKTITLRRIQEMLEHEREILVSKSLAVDKNRVSLNTLIIALFADLAREKDFKIPT